MHQLEIYIEKNCPGCQFALYLAAQAQENFPEIEVRIIDLALPNIKKPDFVFAVPAYTLNGKRLWLGNPHRSEFLELLRAIAH
jgi:hypothetical protein